MTTTVGGALNGAGESRLYTPAVERVMEWHRKRRETSAGSAVGDAGDSELGMAAEAAPDAGGSASAGNA